MSQGAASPPQLHDYEPEREQLLQDALAGLHASPKQLPCKYFYDEQGSALFEQICELPEYYPTRTELAIMRKHASEMAECLGARCLLIEYGSGSGAKTRLLLDQLVSPAAYVPVDISREHLVATARLLASDYPDLEILPVCADFTKPFGLPIPARPPERHAVYFPGSTIGNFTRRRAIELLQNVAALCGKTGIFLIGVDLVKDRATLERAYDDASGVTAEFNRNLLRRLNRELGADFVPERFAHRAVWVEDAGRIEMHLVSDSEQQVHLGSEIISFSPGESICTEHSHKYTLASFSALAAEAGFRVEHVWTDSEGLFSVQALAPS